ncbi:MAG: hypothetical protein QM723_27275 [Myxococcaceae bacterium]
MKRARWALVSVVAVSLVAHAEDAWKQVKRESDGLVLTSRGVKDTAFPELRVTMHTDASAERLQQAVWDRRPDTVEGRMIEKSVTLFDESGDRLLYIRLKPPVIGRRDYTIRYRALADEGTGVRRVWFRLENESGPPPRDGVTRLRVVRGEWVFTPDPNGGTSVSYTCVSDPAGDVPVWMATGEQENVAVEMVREVVQRASEHKPVSAI